MYHSVPCEPGVIHNNMDLALPELSCLSDQFVDVVGVQHIPRNRESFPAGLIDVLCDCLRFAYYTREQSLVKPWKYRESRSERSSTGVNILHHNLCALLRK